MSKRVLLVVVVAALALILLGSLAGGRFLGEGDKAAPEVVGPGPSGIEESAGTQEELGTLGMPVPGFEGTPEMVVVDEEGSGVVSSGMPVPGFVGTPEMVVVDEEGSGVVSSGMPVPGFEDVPEMIVVEE